MCKNVRRVVVVCFEDNLPKEKPLSKEELENQKTVDNIVEGIPDFIDNLVEMFDR